MAENFEHAELVKLRSGLDRERFKLDIRCREIICTKADFEKYQKIESERHEDARTALLRYNQLIDYGGLASDLKPSVVSHSFSVMTLFYLSHYGNYKIQEMWSQGNKKIAFERLLAERDFYLNSVQYEQSLLFIMISLLNIERSQALFQEYFPKLDSKDKQEFIERANIQLDFDDLKEKAYRFEIKTV